ncbi:MAG: IPT/TIG domain-containing protein [Bryobacteraceae bacterium]|nr:IPT/TIG domain-containing protein [Bryobacteraceae bacterium]
MALPNENPHLPRIDQVTPTAAIPGGEFLIRGKDLQGSLLRPDIRFGEVQAPVIVGSDTMVIARVPEGASIGELNVGGSPWTCDIGIQIADSLHPVSSPAIDTLGNIYATFSGARGQKTPVAVYKVDLNYSVRPFITDLMNATGLAFGADGALYISSRYEGIIYQANGTGDLSVYCEGMGTATGLAFDRRGNLFVGDRSGTIFKISPDRQIYVFATLEPSVAAYHLAFDEDGNLYVSGPTTSSFDTIQRISPAGEVSVFYRGLGRPQGLAFDADGNLYCCASLRGRRGVVRITPAGEAELFLSGPNIVGLAFSPSRAMIVATNNAIFRVDTGIKGRPLP